MRFQFIIMNLLWKITALLIGEEKNIAFHFNVLGVVNLMGDVDAVEHEIFGQPKKKSHLMELAPKWCDCMVAVYNVGILVAHHDTLMSQNWMVHHKKIATTISHKALIN